MGLAVRLCSLVLDGLTLLILARCVLSFLPVRHNNGLARAVYAITEPMLKPFRVVVRAGATGLDLSPMFALLVLQIIRRFVFGG